MVCDNMGIMFYVSLSAQKHSSLSKPATQLSECVTNTSIWYTLMIQCTSEESLSALYKHETSMCHLWLFTCRHGDHQQTQVCWYQPCSSQQHTHVCVAPTKHNLEPIWTTFSAWRVPVYQNLNKLSRLVSHLLPFNVCPNYPVST